jgi:hypothetical protein
MTATTIQPAKVIVLAGTVLWRHGRAYLPGETLETTPSDAAKLCREGSAEAA